MSEPTSKPINSKSPNSKNTTSALLFSSPLEAALFYLKKRWNPIPLKWKTKEPLFSWAEYQTRRVTEGEIKRWFSGDQVNVGMITGRISGLLVLDIDSRKHPEAQKFLEGKELPDTLRNLTHNGIQYFFKYPDGIEHIPCIVGLQSIHGIDIKADGGYVVVPPSIHPEGTLYKWEKPQDGDIKEPPTWLLDAINSHLNRRKQGDKKYKKVFDYIPITEGERNDTLTSLAGLLKAKGLNYEEARQIVFAINKFRCEPPLPEAEVVRIVDSVFSYPDTPQLRSPKGAENHAYILPEVEELLKNYNPDKPVFITEGEKKAREATLKGFPTVGLGCFKESENDFLPELEKFVWTDRKVYLCFDSDITEKQLVRLAELRLAIKLINHGAVVYSIRLPNEPDGSKNGLDDYLERHEPEEFKKLIENAQPTLELHINSSDILTERLIEEFSRLKSESEKDRCLRLLGKKRGISYRAIAKDICKYKYPNQETPKAVKPKYIAHFQDLVDLVEDENGNVAFLVKTESGLTIKPNVEMNGKVFFPPPRDRLPFKFLPKATEVIMHYNHDTDLDLLNDLTAYFRDVSELPSEGLYYLLAVWVLHTYLIENFSYSPYLWFFGIPERGKTRTGKAIIYVAYRGVHVESLRDAYIIRLASDLKVTFFFDVMDIWRKAERAGSEDLLLQRFERGAFVARVLYPEKGAYEDTVFYDVFGPTVVATNEGIPQALESRAITITMRESSREFDDIPVEKALSLRERLVAFKARCLGKKLPEADKPAKGRFGDILRPLMQIVLLIDPASEQMLQEIIAELERERKEEKSNSPDAKLILVITELEHQVKNGLLSIQVILNRLNEAVDERSRTTSQRLGWHLRKLGFRKRRQKDGTYIEYDRELLARLRDKFGLETSEKNLHHLHYLHQANKDAGFRGEDFGEDFKNPKNLHQDLHHENPHKYWPGVNGVDGEDFLHEINKNKNGHSECCDCNECCPNDPLDPWLKEIKGG